MAQEGDAIVGGLVGGLVGGMAWIACMIYTAFLLWNWLFRNEKARDYDAELSQTSEFNGTHSYPQVGCYLARWMWFLFSGFCDIFSGLWLIHLWLLLSITVIPYIIGIATYYTYCAVRRGIINLIKVAVTEKYAQTIIPLGTEEV